jgi:hypothetical protein
VALIVEDGSIVADAESYASVADADAYFAARANAAWAALATDAAKEAALRSACDYIEAVYGGRWLGDRVSDTQALSWPRSGVCVDGVEIADDAIPAQLVRANMELALKASADSLLADQSAQVTSETVGPISVTYADGARQGVKYAFVDALLGPLLGVGAGQIRVVRA